LTIQKALDVELPVFAFLTMVGVKGYYMETGQRFWRGDREVIDRDILVLPEVEVENYDVKAESLLRPCFDAVWNACGYARSFNYDEKGNWAKNRY
jgi:hypothetical protein